MIKIGVIGGGLNSAVGRAHLSALALANSYEITVASFSRNEEQNKKTAHFINLNENKIYNDYKKLIDENKDQIDLVLVLTPTDQHKDQVIYALKNGLNVICEKALGTSVEEIQEIRTHLMESKQRLYVIYNYLGYPMVKELKYMIQNGFLGNVHTVQIEMPQEGFTKLINGQSIVPQSWRLKDQFIPTISLDLGVHLHMLVHYLTQKVPFRVSASSKSRGNFKNIIDDVNAIIEYSDEMTCNMWYSKSALGHRNGLAIRVYGTKGSANWIQMDPEYIQFNTAEGLCMKIDRTSPGITIANSSKYNLFKGGHPLGFVEALSNYYRDLAENFTAFGEAINKKEVFGLVESLEGMNLLKAIALSSNENKWIQL